MVAGDRRYALDIDLPRLCPIVELDRRLERFRDRYDTYRRKYGRDHLVAIMNQRNVTDRARRAGVLKGAYQLQALPDSWSPALHGRKQGK